tara:strand:- start:2416 stop:2676 length:261 start_codon:yes stop_codon:yes gene_type:complete
MILKIYLSLTIIFLLSVEKIKLSWEISTLHNNYENLQIDYEKIIDLNLKLITQSNLEKSPSSIEKSAKESLGMVRQIPKKISINDE